jgi:hypothetical protein
LILVNDQSADDILTALRNFDPDIEATAPGRWHNALTRGGSQGQSSVEFSTRNRRYHLDDHGLSELAPTGQILTSIAWADIDRFDVGGVRSVSGSTVRIHLPQGWQEAFACEFHSAWRQRVPAAWRTNQLRLSRRLRRMLWVFWLLTCALPVLCLYVLNSVGARGPQAVQPVPGITRVAEVAGGIGVIVWLFNLYVRRETARMIRDAGK